MRKYLRNCKRLFPVYGSCERQYLKRLKSHIQEYLTEHTDYSYDDLVTQFGSPTEVVASYYDSVDENRLLRRINFMEYFRIFSVILIALLIIFLLYKSYVLYQINWYNHNIIIVPDETPTYIKWR